LKFFKEKAFCTDLESQELIVQGNFKLHRGKNVEIQITKVNKCLTRSSSCTQAQNETLRNLEQTYDEVEAVFFVEE
jgi:hypothetical protein